MPSQENITISIDAMGGDFGPQVTVPAAIQFLKKSKTSHNIVLVGIEDLISPLIEKHQGSAYLKSQRLRVHAATQVVEMDEAPAHALKRKKDSSMRVSINLVKEGETQACVSAGNTGALMATARFVLKTIKGINRPAICSTMPCQDPENTLHMLDLGANVDSSPETLLQFAVMGSVLTEYVDTKESPRIALLNVGAEEIKGSEKVRAAAVLLADSDLNYVGYIESDEIFHGKVDVIVCDGFEGNVALKASEGVAKMIFDILREEFKRNWLSKFLALISMPILKAMKGRLDPRRYNGATLIGLNGIVVKSHGGTDEFGFLHAIEEASRQAEMKLINHIGEKIKEIV
ncbi:MAG: phosphate acyltransferase PlsX [Acidiferrobacterales bacterium]|nr:phosphate acyltransferase PlsX [Acidiferrobacterales bacterium]